MKKHIRQVQLPEKKKREAIMPLAKSAAPVSPVPER